MIELNRKCPNCRKGIMKPAPAAAEPTLRALCTVCRYEDDVRVWTRAEVKRPKPRLGSISLWYSKMCLD